MTRNPTLRQRHTRVRSDLHESVLRIVTTAAAGFVVIFLATVFFWK